MYVEAALSFQIPIQASFKVFFAHRKMFSPADDRVSQSSPRRSEGKINQRAVTAPMDQTARECDSMVRKAYHFHSDMRPANTLLDADVHVQICEFGKATKRGEELPSATGPYYRLTPAGEPPLAGPTSEQFGMGSCIDTIRMGHQP